MAVPAQPPLRFRPPQYDVITDFSFLTKIHPQKAAEVPTMRPPSPPPPVRRRLPVVGFILKPVEEPASTPVPQETPMMPLPPVPPPPPPPAPVVRRLKPQIYSLTEQLAPPLPLPPPPPLPQDPVPIPAPPPPPVENKLMLPEYCMTLDLNYHQPVTSVLLQHLNALNADAQARPNVVLLTGKSGIGKTFCVRKTCQLGGYDLLEMDNIQTDPEEQARNIITTRPDPFGLHRDKRICVALFEAVDGMDKERCTGLTKILQALTGNERSKEKRRMAIRFRVNFVILTAANRYDPNIRDLVYKIKPTEVKVNELNFDQRVTLVEKSCAYWGQSLTPRIIRLVTANPDNTSSLLTKVASLLLTAGDEPETVDYAQEEQVNNSMKTDERSIDLFACCKILLKPPETLNPKTDQYETLPFAQYEETWNLAGEKVVNTLFNSYQNFVHFIPETPAAVQRWLEVKARCDPPEVVQQRYDEAKLSMKDISGSGNYFYRGLDAMAELADSFSLMDSLTYAVEDIGDDVMKRVFKTQLQDVVSRNSSNPNIDARSRLTNLWKRPPCLSRCNVQQPEDEKYRFIAMMRQLEAQRQIADFTYQPNPTYDLTKHVGWYATRSDAEPSDWIMVDMFANDRVIKKSRKRKPEGTEGEPVAKESKITPKMECIKLYSHRWCTSSGAEEEEARPAPVSQPEPLAAKTVPPASKFMIRLSNGEYVERKPREKKR